MLHDLDRGHGVNIQDENDNGRGSVMPGSVGAKDYQKVAEEIAAETKQNSED